MRNTRCALKPDFHLLQVQSKSLFQLLKSVMLLTVSQRGCPSNLWVRLVLLTKPYCELFDSTSEFNIILLLVPKQEGHVEREEKASRA